MTVDIVDTHFTILDYCTALGRNEIQVNRDYQRSDKVWPDAAKSFLIESILLGYPVPKLSIFQKLDVKGKTTIKEIVDGQQRSMAILDYYHSRYQLARTIDTEELVGEAYETLPDEYKEKFLNYRLSVDLFVGATPESIREVFRRMNSYTVPLNPEEERHATFQGEFKWFVYEETRKWERLLAEAGVFGEKQFVRMADSKLLSEICHALLNGISTTSKAKLRALYKEFDKNFAARGELEARLAQAFDRFVEWPDVFHTEIVRPFMMYSLLLAIMHVTRPDGAFQDVYAVDKPRKIRRKIAVNNLLTLSEAVESDADGGYGEFVTASSSKTNVKRQREIRFEWFCRALLDEM
jgi:uncharacterized protein DUF262